MAEKSLWEMLIPHHSFQGREFTQEDHKAWDEGVRNIRRGLQILRPVNEEWRQYGVMFSERLVPVRVECTDEEFSKISDFTLRHYNLRQITTYKTGSNVILRKRER